MLSANQLRGVLQMVAWRVRFPLWAAAGLGQASSLANAARLRGQLAGQEIAGGHAFEKHVLQQGEFNGLGIGSREQFANHIENIVNNPTALRQLSGGRSAYWDNASGTVGDQKSARGWWRDCISAYEWPRLLWWIEVIQMEIIDTNVERSNIKIGRDELLIVNAALNEVCNGIEVFEFETRIGANRERVSALLKEISLLLDKMDSPRT
jgi:hypothetical protein